MDVLEAALGPRREGSVAGRGFGPRPFRSIDHHANAARDAPPLDTLKAVAHVHEERLGASL